MTDRAGIEPPSEAFASGKGRGDENFPVGSRLISARHRAPILAFYRFARIADDVADNPDLGTPQKLRLLDRLEEGLVHGSGDPAGCALRAVLDERGLTIVHACELLAAFRMDTIKRRYRDLDELQEYCRFSAMPVGRFVLDVHEAPDALYPLSDPICAALQIINHLQDCAADYRNLDRLYLPLEAMERHGARPEDLLRDHTSPGLRACIDELADLCRGMLAQGSALPRGVESRRLAAEITAICRLAELQLDHLARHDPLAGSARPSKLRMSITMAGAVVGTLAPKRRAAPPPRGHVDGGDRG